MASPIQSRRALMIDRHARTSEWEKEVLKLTAQAGVDHILEVAGGKSLAQSIAAIKPGGQIAVIGILENFSSDFPIFSLLLKQVILRGIISMSAAECA